MVAVELEAQAQASLEVAVQAAVVLAEVVLAEQVARERAQALVAQVLVATRPQEAAEPPAWRAQVDPALGEQAPAVQAALQEAPSTERSRPGGQGTTQPSPPGSTTWPSSEQSSHAAAPLEAEKVLGGHCRQEPRPVSFW